MKRNNLLSCILNHNLAIKKATMKQSIADIIKCLKRLEQKKCLKEVYVLLKGRHIWCSNVIRKHANTLLKMIHLTQCLFYIFWQCNVIISPILNLIQVFHLVRWYRETIIWKFIFQGINLNILVSRKNKQGIFTHIQSSCYLPNTLFNVLFTWLPSNFYWFKQTFAW